MNRQAADVAYAESHQRLIQAAAEAFMEEGYRASIDRIAKRAGVARQTIYNHFPSKEDLFSEVANVIVNTILVSLDGATGDMRERLMRFALVLRQRVLSDEGIGMFRTIIAEVPRFPALGQAFLEKGPEQTIRRLAEFISGAMNAGTLRRDAVDGIVLDLVLVGLRRDFFGMDPQAMQSLNTQESNAWRRLDAISETSLSGSGSSHFKIAGAR